MTMLSGLRAPEGATKNRKRIGRGESSGWGKTAGKGHKGQAARTGKGKPRPGFEGGQTPLYRRMPKRGFSNTKFATRTLAVNVGRLAEHFSAGESVDLRAVIEKGLGSKRSEVLRILGQGDLAHALVVDAFHVTPAAKDKILAAGGTLVDRTAGDSTESSESA